jgi:hypothetical protein
MWEFIAHWESMTKTCFYRSKNLQVISAGFRALFFPCDYIAQTPLYFRRSHAVVVKGDMDSLVKN